MRPLAYGFIEGIHQGVSALVRILLLPVSGFGALTGVVALDRLGKGLRTGPRDTMIAAASTEHQLGRNFGLHRAMDTAAAFVGPLVAFALLVAVPVGLGGDTRSVDDQVEWLDDSTLLNGLPRGDTEATTSDVWSVPADGGSAPMVLIPHASSPAVVAVG
jgi:hypothetical protein